MFCVSPDCFFSSPALRFTHCFTLTLALTTSRPTYCACLHRWDPLIWLLLLVECFDLCRLEESHGTAEAALLALAAHPPVLADAATAALFADAAHPPVLADTAAAAFLADAAHPPMLAKAAAAALFAIEALPPVLADAAATALLALAALPPVLAEAAAAALLVLAGRPPVRTGHETHRARESSRISGSKQLAGFVKFASTPLKITRQRFEPTS